MRRRYLRYITLLMNMLCLLPMMAVDITIRTDEASPVRFVYGCQVFTHSGTYTNVEYEGELRTLNLRFECNKSYSSLSQTIELGQDALFGCKVIHPEVAGVSTYYDTLVNSKGCDSIVTLTLTAVEPPACAVVHSAIEGSIYEGDTFLFGCKVLTEAGTYHDTLPGAAVTGCDSIVTLTLTVVEPPACEDVHYAYEDSIYEGEKYLFGCKVLIEAGEYKDTLSGAAVTGCDSIVTLTLSYKTPLPLCEDVYYAYEDSIYEGEKYLFGCKVLTEAGEYKDTLLNGSANGCDSIVTLTLKIMTIVYDSVRQAHYGEVAETFCKGTSITTVSGKELTVNGALVFNDTVLNFRPMETDEVNHKHIYHDTIVSYQLNVWPIAESAFEDSIYEGEKYLFGCRVIDTAGIYVDTLINGSANGCDSIVTLTLKIMPPLYDSIRQPHYGEVIETLCKGTILTTVSGNKLTVNGAMEFNDTLLNFIPMETDEVNRRHIYHDTIVTYQLDVWDEARGYMEDSIYFNETYLFHCEQLTDTGTYTHTLPGQSMHGCDSIITLHLTLRTHYDSIRIYNEGEQYDTICLGETYTSISGKRTTISGETAFSDTLSDYKEMLVDDENHIRIYYDTVVSYHISVWETAEGFATDSIYEGETYLFHCEQLTDSGTYTHVLPKQSIHGCDSTITLHLTFRTKYDSIRVYHPGDTIVTVCPGTVYTIGGKDYAVTEGLEVTDTIADFIDMETDDIHHQYIYHDSLLTYHFSLWETARGYMEDSIYFNETYLFHCEQLTDTGTYTHTLPGQSMHGCDSIITLHLTLRTYYDSVRVYVTGEQYDTVCVGEEYISIGGKLTTINGETAFSDTLTDYIDMYPDDANHHRVYTDSVVTYHISVWQPTESSIEDSIYAGQTYLFHGEQLTDTGIYVHTLRGQNMRGCDSIVTLHLKMWTPVYNTLYEYHIAELYDTVCPGAPFTAYSGKEYEIKAAQTIYDTVADYLPMQVDKYQFTYTYHDTVNIYHLSLWTPGDSLITDSIYKGESYPFRGRQLTDAGTYRDTLRGADMHECDSIVTLVLTYRQPEPLTPPEIEPCDTVWYPFADSIAEGEKYLFGCQMLDTIGTFTDTLHNAAANGCDSIVILTLTYKQPEPIVIYDSVRTYVYGEIYDTVCLGNTYMIADRIYTVEAEMAVSDTLTDYLPMRVDEELHQHIYTDSVTTYYLSVWLPSDSTVQDSIILGDSYVFGTDTITPSELGELIRYDTLPNAHGCDSIVTMELKVLEVFTIREYVYAAKQDTLCKGDSYTYGEHSLTLSGDTVVSDTVVAVRVVEDEEQHTVTYTDSVTTHTLYVWHNELNINIGELNWGYAFCGTPYSGDTAVLQTLREAIEADELFQSDTTIRVLYKDSTGNYVPYTGSEIAATMDELSLRIEVSNACGILRYDTTLVIAQPDYEKGVEFTDMPAVSKYNDWLLMVDLDSLNNYYGLYPEPDSVRWYRIVGDEIDISADELVGTGYYYTDDRHLVGKYYAIISMPETRDECGGTWSTRVLVHSPANAPLLLAPNIGKPGKPMSLYNLIADLPTTLSIYNAEGIQLLTWTHTSDGTKAAAVPTQGLQSGVYLLYVSNAEQREAIRFIIRQ